VSTFCVPIRASIIVVLYFMAALVASGGLRHASADEKPLPTTEQFNGALSTCAAGLDVTINADLLGSVASIYSGERSNGAASFKTATKFLELFPETDRKAVYELYTKCISQIVGNSAVTLQPSPSKPAILRPTFTATSTDFDVQGRCRRSGGLVVCELTITNRGPTQHVFLHTDAKLYDKDSHAYHCDKTTLADNESRGAYVMATLLHELPAKASLQCANVPPSVSAIYRLEFHLSNGQSNPPPFVIDAVIPLTS
jgi:hypothetical protein